MKSLRFRHVAAFTLLGLTLAACGGSADGGSADGGSAEVGQAGNDADGGGNGAGGTLVYVQSEDILNFDPSIVPFGNVINNYTIFDALIDLDENDEPQPALATEWQLSDDGLLLTMQVRDDVVFHDGEPFTAGHVKFNIERYADPKTGAQMRGVLQWIDRVEVSGEHELELHFAVPRPAIWHGLSQLFITQNASDDKILSAPVGTGPFQLASYSPGNGARYVANNQYWRDGPYLDAVEMRIIPDAQAAAVSLEIGEAQIYAGPTWQDLGRLADVPGIEVTLSDRAPWMQDMIFNTRSEPLGDPRVRKAIDLAIDRERVVNIAYGGFSEPWCLPWHEASVAFDQDLARNCEQDLELARELLASAGYEDGFTTSITVWDGGINIVGRDLAVILQQDLAKIGIELEIKLHDPGEARSRLIAGEYDLFAHTVGSVWADPSILYDGSALWSPDAGRNLSGYASEKFTSLVAEASTELDTEARRDLFRQINTDHMLENVWVSSIARYDAAFARSDSVAGFGVGVAGHPILREVRLAQ